MRIISPTGKVCKVLKVEPYAEKKDIFNGKSQRITELAISLDVRPTGVKCFLECARNDFAEPFVYIGNLTPEKVQEILDALLKNGYYDFSRFEYQKKVNAFGENIKIDGGVTLPYYQESDCALFGAPLFSRNDTIDFPEEDDEEYEEEDFDENCEE